MPTTNLFDDSSSLRTRMSRGLGFDPSTMIQGQYPQIMQDVEGRRQMGRKKYSEDILTQQLQQAAQELQNRMTGYDFGQKQEYYNQLKTPEGQAMWKAYQQRMGLPAAGAVTNPEQIKDLTTLSGEALGQENVQKQIAMHLLSNYIPIQGQPDRPEITWARSVLGVPGVTNAPAVPAPTTPATTQPGRSALGVFLNRALPAGVGTGGAVAAGMRTPGPWPVKTGAGLATYLLGEKLTRMATGELTPEEQAAHPLASGAGSVAGYVAGLLGGKGLGGTTSMASPVAPGAIRIRGGTSKSVSGTSKSVSGVKVKGGGFKESLMNMMRRKPQAPAPVQYGQPTPGLPPSMGNVPGAQVIPNPIAGQSTAPAFTDPRLQAFIQQYFKKVQPSAQP